MPHLDHVITHQVPQTFRAAKVAGMFDVPVRDQIVRRWTVDVPIETFDWSVGAIVGPSGSGKTTLARHVFGDAVVSEFSWSADTFLDDFPPDLPVQEIVAALSAVGLSTVPSWLLPFRMLSTGQQFRATLARALLTNDLVVFDEFTSVVDRSVARAAAVAVSKFVRRRAGARFVAVTCHYDVLPWLEPDWVLDLASDPPTFDRRRLRRPPIRLDVYPGDLSAWPLFREHHYLTCAISRNARVFLAWASFSDEESPLVGFFSILPAAGMRGWWRGHRTVVLPDYQGMGIGNRMIEIVAEQLWQRERKRFRATTSAPGIIHHRRRHPEMWRLVSGPEIKSPVGPTGRGTISSAGRLTTTWEYIPEDFRGTNR